MKGKYHVKVQNESLRYEFDIKRNITVLKGDSATGKTTFVEMIQEFIEQGEDSGVELFCDVKCRVLSGNLWEEQLEKCDNSLVFIDEGNRFVKTKEFAEAIRYSNNYYIIVTRESLETLPLSVDEIYGIRSSGKYGGLNPVYHQFYRIYEFGRTEKYPVKTEIMITEDSNSGFEFFSDIALKNNTECISANGKSNIYGLLAKAERDKDILVIADGAAFGAQMVKLEPLVKRMPNVHLYLPESFEWIILKSEVIRIPDIDILLSETFNYADSEEYFSWEQFFTALLIRESDNGYLKYSKSRLNENYKIEGVQKKILKSIEQIQFEKD